MNKTVLIVDDEKDMVFGLQMMFEAHDFRVFTAYDGQEALEKARMNNPKIIILDLMIPKIDGYKVCRMLKFDEKYKKIPIIMLTARTSDNEVKTGREVGADAYIIKPFDNKVLLDKVNELLNSA